MNIELNALRKPGQRVKHVIKVRMRKQNGGDGPSADRAFNRGALGARIDQNAARIPRQAHNVRIDLQRTADDRTDIQIIHQNVLLESSSSVTGPSLINDTFMSAWKMPVST